MASLTASATSGAMPTPCCSAKATTARRTPGTAAGVACVRSSSRSISWVVRRLLHGQRTDTFGSWLPAPSSWAAADADELQREHRAVVDDVAELELAQRRAARPRSSRGGRPARPGSPRAAAPRRSARSRDGRVGDAVGVEEQRVAGRELDLALLPAPGARHAQQQPGRPDRSSARARVATARAAGGRRCVRRMRAPRALGCTCAHATVSSEMLRALDEHVVEQAHDRAPGSGRSARRCAACSARARSAPRPATPLPVTSPRTTRKPSTRARRRRRSRRRPRPSCRRPRRRTPSCPARRCSGSRAGSRLACSVSAAWARSVYRRAFSTAVAARRARSLGEHEVVLVEARPLSAVTNVRAPMVRPATTIGTIITERMPIARIASQLLGVRDALLEQLVGDLGIELGAPGAQHAVDAGCRRRDRAGSGCATRARTRPCRDRRGRRRPAERAGCVGRRRPRTSRRAAAPRAAATRCSVSS